MMNRIRGHSRDAVVQRLFPRRSRFVEPQRAGPLSAQNRILRIFNVSPLSPPLPPSKTQFRETRDFTTGSHSRRIFRNCTFVPSNSSDLFELFVRPLSLFDRLSEIGQYRSLKEKASLKASFFERAIFFLCDLKYLRYICHEILFKRIWQIQGSMEDFRQLVEKSIEIVKIKLVRYTRFNSFCLGNEIEQAAENGKREKWKNGKFLREIEVQDLKFIQIRAKDVAECV